MIHPRESFRTTCGCCDREYWFVEDAEPPECSDCGNVDLCPGCAHRCDGCESSWLCTDCVNALHPMGEICPKCRKVAA